MFDGVTCLPGEGDQPEQIYFSQIETTPGCVPDNMVGIQLDQGEFAKR